METELRGPTMMFVVPKLMPHCVTEELIDVSVFRWCLLVSVFDFFACHVNAPTLRRVTKAIRKTLLRDILMNV